MEQGAKVAFTNHALNLTNANNDSMSLRFGTGLLKLDGAKKITVEIDKNHQSFYDKKFLFAEKFIAPPVVFIQSNFIPDGGLQTKYVISAVKADNEGFFVDFLGNGNGRKDAFMSLHPRELHFSYFAIGK